MKKFLFVSILIMVCAGTLFAQEMQTTPAVKDSTCCDANDSQCKKGEVDRLNLQIMFGHNFSQNEGVDGVAEHTFTFSKDVMSREVSLALAKEFTPCWGWRLSIGESENIGCTNFDKQAFYSFSDAELFGDLTLDITDMLFRRRESMFLNMKLFGGVGGLYTFGFSQENAPKDVDSHLCLGARGGVDLRFRLSKHVSLGAEAGLTTMYPDNFNGIVDDFPVDARFFGKVGLIINFAQQPLRKCNHSDKR